MSSSRYIGKSEATNVSHYQIGGDVLRFDRPLCALLQALTKKKKGDFLRCSDVLLTDISDVDIGLLGMVHIVNVSASDPAEFFFESYGFRAGMVFGENFQRREIAEISAPSFRQFVLDSYELVKSSRRPWMSDVLTQQPRFKSSYSRLMVPLCDDGGNLSHVLVAIHRHSVYVQ